MIAGTVFEQDMTFEIQFGCDCTGLAGMVRLGCTLGDYRISTLGNRVGHQELELARLVTSCGQSGTIVTFDPDVGAAEFFGYSFQRF